MPVLVLTAEKRLPDLTGFYRSLGSLLELDIHRLDKAQQSNLRRTLRVIDLDRYSRVLLDLPFRQVHRQWRTLRRLPGLLIYDEDACQNYLANSRWHGAFSQLYRRVPNAQVVVTGARIAERLGEEGFDAHWLPKGYDSQQVYFQAGERDIELGFIGRTSSKVYSGRQELLAALAAEEHLQMLRTEPGADYRAALNRIRFFISADVGLGEYMAKNFEAMACGCVLLAWRQGQEEQRLGLEHGRHLLLYSSLAELRDHLSRLRGDPRWAADIADQGRAWTEARYSYAHMAACMAKLLMDPRPFKPAVIRSSWWRSLIRRAVLRPI
ncbi:glycosyltransferase family 1 protein [Pseudomonas sp. PDM17]|uniref:glycosyltransferase n=1 Tax=Pseudomonas sp. PDM17 TaxID=2769285 RepID=UPI00177E7860|nr:glycosyltransferase [Pseudomonas sp. PDM17]MBD9502572.1 glycosyltransferase family 1 protein [Pseudomonas sp. PDM17]